MVAVRLDRLAHLSRAILEAPRLEDRLQLVTDAALVVTAADHASIRLCDAKGTLKVGARSGRGASDPPPPFTVDEGVMGWVARSGEPAHVSRAKDDPRFRAQGRAFAIDSLMSVPIGAAGTTRGVLSISSPRPNAFDSDDQSVVELLAMATAQALRESELEQLAMIDCQTQAYNRRCLLPRLSEEMSRARRQGQSLSVLLLDLDHFKSVNDCYGHAVGDDVLRAFADRVRECVRESDVLVRRGGEEFVLIMPATDAAQGLAVAERIRAMLDERPLELRDDLELRQTVSVGMATWDGEEPPERLDERADLAMYEAKRRGRNGVVESTRLSRQPGALGLDGG